MSTENSLFGAALTALAVLLLGLAAAATLVLAEDIGDDPVLAFYCDRAAAVTQSRDPFERGLSYSFTARTYLKDTDDQGRVEKTDSLVARYFISFGRIDSQQVVTGRPDLIDSLPLRYPNVFDQDYHFQFYPNDTGGPRLAIGFDTGNDSTRVPVGLAILDRERYFLHRLYLYFPYRPDFKRFTRSYRMVERQGFVFVDSIWEVVSKAGIFATEDYRVETGITDIEIGSPSGAP
jgi:hypothetical protein